MTEQRNRNACGHCRFWVSVPGAQWDDCHRYPPEPLAADEKGSVMAFPQTRRRGLVR